MQETPFRTRSLKATSTIINIYKQGTRTNIDKNIDDLFMKFLLYWLGLIFGFDGAM